MLCAAWWSWNINRTGGDIAVTSAIFSSLFVSSPPSFFARSLVKHMLIQRKEGNIGWWAEARNSLNSWLDIDARPSRSVGRDSASWSTSTVFGWSFRNVLEKVPHSYFFLKNPFYFKTTIRCCNCLNVQRCLRMSSNNSNETDQTQGCETMQLAGNWLFPRKWWTIIWGSHS